MADWKCKPLVDLFITATCTFMNCLADTFMLKTHIKLDAESTTAKHRPKIQGYKSALWVNINHIGGRMSLMYCDISLGKFFTNVVIAWKWKHLSKAHIYSKNTNSSSVILHNVKNILQWSFISLSFHHSKS